MMRDSRWPSWLVTSSMTGMVLGYLLASSSAWLSSAEANGTTRKKRGQHIDEDTHTEEQKLTPRKKRGNT